MTKLWKMAIADDPALCPNGCGRSYKGNERKYHLKRHLIYACGVNPQFECTLCPKQFRYKQSLQYHLLSTHKNVLLKGDFNV